MTATSAPTPTTGGAAALKRMNWRAFVGPSIALAIVVCFGLARLVKSPDTDTLAQATAQAAAQGAQQGASQATVAPPTSAAPVVLPAYDYLTCSHVTRNDPPCVPVLAWPLTDGAKELIGYQKGTTVDGALDTVKTRLIYDQIRNKMAGVDACSLWLSINRDQLKNPTLTVWSNQQEAPQGAVKLVDCAPRAGATAGSIPTEGMS